MTTAQDIMVTGVITLKPEISLTEAFSTLQEHQISGAPVVNSKGKLLGVLSQTDLLREAFTGDVFTEYAADSYYVGIPFFEGGSLEGLLGKLDEVKVEEAMNPNVVAVEPTDSVESLAAKMRSNHIHRLIVAENDTVVGLVTTFDILKLIEIQ